MPKPIERTDDEYRWLAIAAARLRSDGHSQTIIAQRLVKSQPEISRLLTFAEKHDFLARAPGFLSRNISPEDLVEVECRYFARLKVIDCLEPLKPRNFHLDVHVVPEENDEFAVAAAGRVVDLLLRAKVVGIMWGRTVGNLVQEIRARGAIFDQPEPRSVQCIPLCGDPVYLMNLRHVKYSASHLAAELAQAINPVQPADKPTDQPCLVGVPAYISRRVLLQKGDPPANWLDFVQSIPGYDAIFVGKKSNKTPLVHDVDTIITGTGIIEMKKDEPGQKTGVEIGKMSEDKTGEKTRDETGDFIQERLAQESLTKDALKGLIYGDIGGLLLERKGLKPKEKKFVEELNRGWTGVKVDQLHKMAQQASATGHPGIIVVAAGAPKVEMIREIVSRGLVNELVIDAKLAEELTKKAS